MADTENLQRIVEKLQGLSNEQLQEIVSSGQAQEIATQVTDVLSGGELANIVEGEYEYFVPDGQVTVGHWVGAGQPATSVTDIQKVVPAGSITQYNSNETAIQRGTVRQVYNTEVDATAGKWSLSANPKVGQFVSNAAYFIGEVNQAVAAAQVGIMLGRTIDSALYNANPDYWDSIGMSSLNPETWASITNGNESLGADLFNMIFGISPTGQVQPYMDETAFSYIAKALLDYSFFNTNVTPGSLPEVNQILTIDNFTIGSTLDLINLAGGLESGSSFDYNAYPYAILCVGNANNVYTIQATSFDFISWMAQQTIKVTSISSGMANISPAIPVYGRYQSGYSTFTLRGEFGNLRRVGETLYNGSFSRVGNNFGTGNYYAREPIVNLEIPQDGLGVNPNTTLPDTSTWTNPQTTLESLQEQYPDLWDKAITYDNFNPDGTVTPQTWVPVPWPTIDPQANPWTQTQPTYDPETNPTPDPQTDPTLDLNTWPSPQPNPITRTITENPNPNTEPDVPENPPDTGTGISPTPIPPTGSASALWSVYHPTAAQINSFGAWLWTDNIIQQFVQALNSPIDGIITLHKIYATPIDSGQGTIVIGRLDSEVPTALVTEQYVQVDCGTVSLQEQFGNVFDYIGTDVSIYLPFIGIVKLNTSDVMRSTIGVKYNVDVFTGACLAMISVLRDGRESILYQYTGMCSVEYPLTGGQHSGLINGIMGAVSGLISTGAGIASANPLAIAGGVMGVAGGATSMISTQNARSGTFAANAGAMGVKKPYIIIERPQTRIATNDENYTGYSTNASVLIGDCSGIVKCRQVHVTGINATAKELDMINALLTTGILV